MSKTTRAELKGLIAYADQQIHYFDTIVVNPFPIHVADAFCEGILLKKAGRSVTDDIKRALDDYTAFAINNSEALFRSSSRAYRSIRTVAEKYYGLSMSDFFVHDASHLSDTFSTLDDVIQGLKYDSLRDNPSIDPNFFIDGMKNIDATNQGIARMYSHPWRLIKALSIQKLGETPTYEPVSIQQQFYDVANVLQMRFSARVTDQLHPETPLRKSISITGDDISIVADPGLIWSVIHNNSKNSLKKFSQQECAFIRQSRLEQQNNSDFDEFEAYNSYLKKLPHERVSYLSCHSLNDQYVALSFSDSGSPIDLNAMVYGMQQLMKQYGDNLDWVTRGMKNRYTAWKKNDYQFNSLTAEDMTNSAFMAQLSGQGLNSITSGFGLYGTRHIVDSLGGATLYTTTFESLNPVFMYILPREPISTTQQAKEVRKQIIQHGLRNVA